MTKSNKGMAMSYTLVAMIIIFAACLLITTIALFETTETKTFAVESEKARIAQQIGEIYCESENEQSFFDALRDSGFIVNEDKITYSDITFSLTVTNNSLELLCDDKLLLHIVLEGGAVSEWSN